MDTKTTTTPTTTPTTPIITADGAEPHITITWTETTWGRTTYYGDQAIAIAAKLMDGATVDDALWEAVDNDEIGYWPNETGDCDSEIEYRVYSSNVID